MPQQSANAKLAPQLPPQAGVPGGKQGFVLQPPALAKAAPARAPAPASTAPRIALLALYERGLTSAAMSFHTAAIADLREVVAQAPKHAAAWRSLAALLRLGGHDAEADAAETTARDIGPDAVAWPTPIGERSPAKRARNERKLEEALSHVAEAAEARVLRDHLFAHPTDEVAMRLLARVEWRQDDGVTAHNLLERALSLAPDYTAARADFARLLVERKMFPEAVSQTASLLAVAPRNPEFRALRAEALSKIGNFHDALALVQGLIEEQPRNPHHWVSLGGCLRHIGRREDSAAAYRTCLDIDPAFGLAYSGLADLKGRHLTTADVTAMRTLLADGGLQQADRMTMSYALAQALEKEGRYGESFAAYEAGAAAFRAEHAGTQQAHDPEASTDRLRRIKRVFTAANRAARQPAAGGAASPTTPLFVVGMPRAGSTLVEQILASHSQVEGTRELPVMNQITRDLALRRLLLTPHAYPEHVLDLSAAELAALGDRYIRDAGAYRQTTLPYFVDKRPWNWMDAGLIDLILPQARIIDIRREPMAACFAMFKQLLPVDAAFSYDLDALGRYYNEYVDLMRYWDIVMPGRIHYVSYERLVDDTEGEIRRLLEYCGLPFEAGCLRFWETERAVATPSAEQVRRPIFKDAVAQWRHFEPWLGRLRDSLAAPIAV